MIQTINELRDKVAQIRDLGWVKSVSNGTAGIGLTFEHLLGVMTNNFEIPDYNGIEIKCKNINARPFLTLFNATPDSHLFVIKDLHQQYGYPDKTHPEFKVFNLSVHSSMKKVILRKHVFSLDVDRINEKIYLKISNLSGEIIDNSISWSFDLLKEKLLRKLSFMLYVRAYSKIDNGDFFFRYISFDFYSLKSFENFIDSIQNGNIRVTFQICVFKSGKRYGQIYDHGTSFSIDSNFLSDLFRKLN